MMMAIVLKISQTIKNFLSIKFQKFCFIKLMLIIGSKLTSIHTVEQRFLCIDSMIIVALIIVALQVNSRDS